MAKVLRLGWREYGNISTRLAKRIGRSKKRFDLVVGIARGGIPLAMVIADELGLKLDIINVKSYTGVSASERKKPLILSTLSSEIEGKKLLLVDDLIEHGDTMKIVTDYLMLSSPSSISYAVLFTKPWNKFKPDFYVEKVDRWVVFPWEVGEYRRAKK